MDSATDARSAVREKTRTVRATHAQNQCVSSDDLPCVVEHREIRTRHCPVGAGSPTQTHPHPTQTSDAREAREAMTTTDEHVEWLTSIDDVRAATRKLTRAQATHAAAIRAASLAGHSNRAIAPHAGLSYEAIRQLLKRQHT